MSTGSTSQLDLNHWLLRVIAFIIDSIIIGVIAYIIFFVAILSIVFNGGFAFGYGFGIYLILPFIVGILEILYFMVMEVFYGATIGKKLLGLQVQTVNGSRVTFEKSFIRNISKIYWLFLLIDWIIAVVTPGNDQRQKYTDRIAGTTVVSTKQSPTFIPQTSPPPPPPPPQ